MQFSIIEFAPITQLFPIFVLPRIIVDGSISVPVPISTLLSIIIPSVQVNPTPLARCFSMTIIRAYVFRFNKSFRSLAPLIISAFSDL